MKNTCIQYDDMALLDEKENNSTNVYVRCENPCCMLQKIKSQKFSTIE